MQQHRSGGSLAGILMGTALALYQVTGYQLFPIAGYSVTAADISVLLFIVVAAAEFLLGKVPYRVFSSGAFFFLMILPIPLLLSGFAPLLYGGDVIQVVKTGLHFAFLWWFTVVAAARLWQPEELELSIQIFIVVAVIVAAFGIYQMFARAFGLPLAWFELTNTSIFTRTEFVAESDFQQLSLRFKNFYRATSVFSEPSYLAAYCGYALIALLLPLVQGQREWFPSIFTKFSAVILSLTLFLTFSLTSVMAIGLFALCSFVWEGRKQQIRLLWGLLWIISAIILGDIILRSTLDISVTEMMFDRIAAILNIEDNPYKENMSGESFLYRASSLGVSIQVWLEYPFSGVGLGLFYDAEAAKLANMLFSVSTYFTLLSETGLQGVSIFLAMLLSICYRAIQNQQFLITQAGWQRISGIASYWCVLLIALGFTNNNLVQPATWVPLAVIFAIAFAHSSRAIRIIPPYFLPPAYSQPKANIQQ